MLSRFNWCAFHRATPADLWSRIGWGESFGAANVQALLRTNGGGEVCVLFGRQTPVGRIAQEWHRGGPRRWQTTNGAF